MNTVRIKYKINYLYEYFSIFLKQFSMILNIALTFRAFIEFASLYSDSNWLSDCAQFQLLYLAMY